MLEYTKSLLQKVSFDRILFVKELKKSLAWLSLEEIEDLKNWSIAKFNALYKNEMTYVFNALAQ